MTTYYGRYSNGVRWRNSRGPREYTCTMCGAWMKGADNCFPGACSKCRAKPSDKPYSLGLFKCVGIGPVEKAGKGEEE